MEFIKKIESKGMVTEVYRSHNITLKVWVLDGFPDDLDLSAEHDDVMYAPRMSILKGEILLNFKRIEANAEDIPKVMRTLGDIRAFQKDLRDFLEERAG